jgi:hypothetical protein
MRDHLLYEPFTRYWTAATHRSPDALFPASDGALPRGGAALNLVGQAKPVGGARLRPMPGIARCLLYHGAPPGPLETILEIHWHHPEISILTVVSFSFQAEQSTLPVRKFLQPQPAEGTLDYLLTG